MKINDIHIWDVNTEEAINIQRLLAGDIVKEGHPDVKYVAGCDLSFTKDNPEAYAVVVVLSYPELEVVEISKHSAIPIMPYRTGLLSFREAPLLIEAMRNLKTEPDIILYDGQGYAHPRRLGLASHMGIITNKPSIGCAKTRLIGDYEEKEQVKGNYSPMYHKDELVGYALYTKKNCKPIFVSIGNLISLDFAKDFVLSCVKNHKIPEPTRMAHIHCNAYRKSNET